MRIPFLNRTHRLEDEVIQNLSVLGAELNDVVSSLRSQGFTGVNTSQGNPVTLYLLSKMPNLASAAVGMHITRVRTRNGREASINTPYQITRFLDRLENSYYPDLLRKEYSAT